MFSVNGDTIGLTGMALFGVFLGIMMEGCGIVMVLTWGILRS